MRWTPDQSAAINVRNCNLLVSAAAGSGKTAVITQRAMDIIIHDQIDVSRILMLTFTNAAASEMRTRLSSQLLQQMDQERQPQRLAYLNNQLDKINESDISTVHAYCIKLLRRHYHAAQVDPAFAVMGEEEADYRSRAMDAAMEHAFEQSHPDFLLLCDTLGGRAGSKIAEIAMSIYQFARTQPDYHDKLADWTNRYHQTESSVLDSVWAQYLMQHTMQQVQDAAVLLDEALSLCHADQGPAAYENALKDDQHFIQRLQNAVMEQDIASAAQMLREHKAAPLGRKKKSDDPHLVEACKNIRNQVKKMIQSLGSSTLMLPATELAVRHQRMYGPLQALHGLILDFDKRYQAMKDQRGLMDFADLQHNALNALAHDEIAQVEKERYDYIFVDEYQDTNLIQESLIQRITSGANLLCVGDVKQSIYAFRQADPDLFLQRRDDSSMDDKAENRLINLNMNFRSSPAVIDSINLIFDTVMSSRLGGVAYDDNERLYAGSPRPQPDDGGNVELIMLDASNIQSAEAVSNVEREAVVAAQRIRDLMGTTIWDGKKGSFRPVVPSDICILAQSFKPIVRDVRRIMEQYGIPLLPQESGEYFDELEIAQVMDILTVVDNRRRDLALISTMASPAFGFQMDDLIHIRKSHNTHRSAFYDALMAYAALDDPLAERIRAFLQQLDQYRDLARYLPLKDFIWRLLDSTGYYQAVGALPGGAVRQANLRMLVDRAHTYSKLPAASLYGFLSYVKRLKKSNASISSSDTFADEAVRFMSIHQSKGLEFPIVVVLGAGKEPNLQSTKSAVPMFKDLGYGTDSYDAHRRQRKSTLSKEAISQAIKKSIYSENMRVFYVALTRAREKLIVIGTTKSSIEKLVAQWALPFIPSMYMGSGANLLGYMGCAAIRNTACGTLRTLAPLPPEAMTHIPNFTVAHMDANQIQVTRARRAGAVAAAMQEAASLHHPQTFLHLPETVDQSIPVKASATALVKGSSPGTLHLSETMSDPAFVSDHQFDAAQRGTITHTVLQHIPLDCDDIDGAIDDLLNRRILPQGAKDVVHTDWIQRFLSSTVAERIRSSSHVRREVPFVITLPANTLYEHVDSDESVSVQGIIDLCFQENGQWILLDYKTNRIGPGISAHQILDHYKPQLDIYTQALEMITGIPVAKAGLYLLSSGQTTWLSQ